MRPFLFLVLAVVSAVVVPLVAFTTGQVVAVFLLGAAVTAFAVVGLGALFGSGL